MGYEIITGHIKCGKPVEILAIIATETDIEQLLGIPDLPADTGTEMASAIHKTLES